MTIAHIQSQGGNATSSTSHGETFGSNVASGSLIVIAVAKGLNSGAQDTIVLGDLSHSGTSTITDLTLDQELAFQTGSGYSHVAIYSCYTTGAGTCTFTLASVQATIHVSMAEFSGDSFDTNRLIGTNEASNATDNTNANTGTVATTVNSVFVGIELALAGTNTSCTPNTDFTQIYDDGAGLGSANSGFRIATAITDEHSWTLGNNLGWAAGIAAYKEVAGAGPATPQGLQGIAQGINVQRSTRLGGELEQ